MDLDLSELTGAAFYETTLTSSATAALEAAHQRHAELTGSPGLAMEVIVPDQVDLGWLVERLVRPLVYHAESSGRPLPDAGDLFVGFFRGDRLSCVSAGYVLMWAMEKLGLSVADLREHFGTGEVDTVLRPGPLGPAGLS